MIRGKLEVRAVRTLFSVTRASAPVDQWWSLGWPLFYFFNLIFTPMKESDVFWCRNPIANMVLKKKHSKSMHKGASLQF